MKSLKELLETEFTANEDGIFVGTFTLDRINEIADCITNLQRLIEIMKRYLELICDLGYDYDGYNKSEDLKELIDELVHYASLGRACNDKEAIFEDGEGMKANILGEIILKKVENE